MGKNNQEKVNKSVFLYCELEFDVRKKNWLKSASGVQRIKGVSRFRMHGDGKVQVSGILDPDVLRKKVEKNAEIKFMQAGLCFDNLYPPEPPKKETKNENTNNHVPNYPPYFGYNGDYGGSYGYFGRYGDQNYYPRPRIFGNHQMLQEQPQAVAEAKKPEPPANDNEHAKTAQSYNRHVNDNKHAKTAQSDKRYGWWDLMCR